MIAVWAGMGALAGGLLAYGFFRGVLWDVPVSSLGSLVGLAAIGGGALGGWLARRRAARRRSTPPGPQGPT